MCSSYFEIVILAVYFDDILLIGNDIYDIETKKHLKSHFSLKEFQGSIYFWELKLLTKDIMHPFDK